MLSAPRLVAEWEPQTGVLLAWPHVDGDWRPFLERVEPVYVELAAVIARYETVLICCRNRAHRERIASLLGDQAPADDRVVFANIPFNDTWIRDYGPLSVARNASRELLKFAFNGWGHRFEAGLDNQAAIRLKEQRVFGATPMTVIDNWILEGGSIDTDGAGTLLTTVSCLTAANRNDDNDRGRIEKRLEQTLGGRRVLWLEHGGLAGDDTDGHIDNLARFCDPTTLCHVICRDENDEHYAPLQAMANQLRSFRRPDGELYRLIALPLPQPVHNANGARLPASYANFLIINGAVLVPVFDDPADAIALAALRPCFPGRELIPIDARPLIEQAGGLHCATLQVAAGVPLLAA